MRSCSYCDKKCTKKSTLVKHQLLCEFLHKSKREKQIEEEETSDLPSYADLVQIVQELAYKNVLLEKKVNDLIRQTPTKKVNVIDWLNENMIPTCNYENAHTLLEVSEKDVQYLMESKMISTIGKIFETVNPETFPMYCAKNIFYIYSDATKWREMAKAELVQLLNKIHNKLLKELCEWRTTNIERINANDQLSILYNKTMIKLMDIEFNHDVTLAKIKTVLSGHLRQSS